MYKEFEKKCTKSLKEEESFSTMTLIETQQFCEKANFGMTRVFAALCPLHPSVRWAQIRLASMQLLKVIIVWPLFMRFVRVPPYESWAFWTNFYFSCEDGEFFGGQTCCTLFHTRNEGKSQKISTCIRIHTFVYANTWWSNRVNNVWNKDFTVYFNLTKRYQSKPWNPLKKVKESGDYIGILK